MAFLLPSSSVGYGDFSWQSQLHQRTKQRDVAAATVGGPPKKLFTATTLSAKAGLNVTRNEVNVKSKTSRRRGVIPARSKSGDILRDGSSDGTSTRRAGRRSTSGGSKAPPRRSKSTTDALCTAGGNTENLKEREGGPDLGMTIQINNVNDNGNGQGDSSSPTSNSSSTPPSSDPNNKSKLADQTSRAETIIKRAATFRRLSLDVAAKHEDELGRGSSHTGAPRSPIRRCKSSDSSLPAGSGHSSARRGGRRPDGSGDKSPRPGLDGAAGHSGRRLKAAAHSFKLSTSSKSLRCLVDT